MPAKNAREAVGSIRRKIVLGTKRLGYGVAKRLGLKIEAKRLGGGGTSWVRNILLPNIPRPSFTYLRWQFYVTPRTLNDQIKSTQDESNTSGKEEKKHL